MAWNPLTKFNVDFTTSGDHVIVPARANAILITRVALIVNASAVITAKDGASLITGGPYPFTGAGRIVLDDLAPEQHSWWEASPGNNFIINSDTGGTRVAGQIWAYLR